MSSLKPFRIFILLLFFIALPAGTPHGQSLHANGSAKNVSVTFDDLPLNTAKFVSNEEMKSIVEKLVGIIRAEGIPVVAFVNEIKLERNGARDPRRVDILKTWLDAGIELGNHTYSHKSANDVPVDDYEQDILQGERSVKELMAERGMKLRYFRHPFLMTGRSLDVKNEITKFLHNHQYIIAPVTIDNSEWIFSAAYDKAVKANEPMLIKQVGEEYIAYMEAKFQYYERQSDRMFGRLMNQILLVHSNRLNSEYFGSLCTMIRSRGYRFITLDEALRDSAFTSRDTYTGRGGISWLDRWAMTQGRTKEFFTGEPRTPAYIMKLAHVDSE